MVRILTLLLIRHGETAHNAEGRIQGQTDIPLSPVGRAQAQATGLHLRHCFTASPVLLPVPDFVYSSDLSRARETAEIVCETARLRTPIVSSLLRERHYGEWQGLLVSDVAVHRRTLDNPPGGETEEQLYGRMNAALAHLSRETGTESTVLMVVGHGGALRALLCRALGLGGRDMGRFRMENCALSVIEFVEEGTEVVSGRVVRINDSGHLRGLDLSAQTLAV